jgi:O-antigen ligase
MSTNFMNTPEAVEAAGAKSDRGFRASAGKIGAGPVSMTPLVIAGFAGFFGVGTLAVLFPIFTLELLGGAAVLAGLWLGIRYLQKSGLEVWQMLVLMNLAGYLLLNYGYENLTIHLGGFPLIISYMTMFMSLGLAAFYHRDLWSVARKEPAVFCLAALFFLTLLHLMFNVPDYGMWAIRDASMFFDSMFLLLGLVWARRGTSVTPLMKFLMIIFLINGFYSLGLPWQEQIWNWSPKSGVFLQIPLFGTYRGNVLYLLLGPLFFLFLGRTLMKWPNWIILPVAAVQLFGLAIHQARTLYVCLLLVLVFLPLVGEAKKSATLLMFLAPPVIAVAALTATGIEIPGRIGPVSADFFKEHFRSIAGAQDTPGSSLEGREDWYGQVFARIKRNPWLGEGFGQALITFENELTGGEVRQPHNSNITVLARLGIVGCVPWAAFHLFVMLRFFYIFRQRKKLDKQFADFLLWLFIVYMVFMLSAAVEATFEFPSAAIPFYFFIGLSLGLARWQIPPMVRQTDQAAGARLVVA